MSKWLIKRKMNSDLGGSCFEIKCDSLSCDKPKNTSIWVKLITGAIIGFVNGFLGAGGGMILVPLLTFLFKMDSKTAHATAVFIMMPICFISGVTYLIKGVVDCSVLLPVGVGTVVGGLVGGLLLKNIANKWLNYIFYLVMIGSGIWIIVR